MITFGKAFVNSKGKLGRYKYKDGKRVAFVVLAFGAGFISAGVDGVNAVEDIVRGR